MYQLRHRNFSYAEAGLDPADMKAGKRPFGGLITDSPEFEFDMEDIARIREEIRRLIERLSHLYTFWKKTEEETEKKARLEEKALNEASKSDAKISKDPPESVAANVRVPRKRGNVDPEDDEGKRRNAIQRRKKKSMMQENQRKKEEAIRRQEELAANPICLVVQDAEERNISSSDDFSLRTGGAENSDNIIAQRGDSLASLLESMGFESSVRNVVDEVSRLAGRRRTTRLQRKPCC
jgi:hypothetical protein